MRDHSILAWGLGDSRSTGAREELGSRGLLAASPSDFANSGNIVPRDRSTSYLDSIEISGGTLRVSLLSITTSDGIIGLLNCGPMNDLQKTVGLRLAKALPGGPEDYTRSSGCQLLSPESSVSHESRKHFNILKSRDGSTTRTGSEGCWFYDDHEFDAIQLELIEVEPSLCWNKEQGTIKSVIEPIISFEPPVLLRLRQQRVESRDFVLMLQFRRTRTTVEAYHCIATCARDTSLIDIAEISDDLSRHLSRKTTASNGWLNLRLALVASGTQSVHMISLTSMMYQPYMTIDVSWEMKKTPFTWAIEGILHEKGLWNELQHVGYSEDTGDLESILDMPAFTWAFTNNCTELVRLLLFMGKAGIDAVDGQTGEALLHWAVQLGHESLVQLLLESGANTETRATYSRTALSIAAGSRQEDIVGLLLSEGANVKSEDHQGHQPLIPATQTGQETIVRLLLDKGADIETKSKHGHTPLHIAINCRHDPLVNLLLERGADIEAIGPLGIRPLHAAVSARNLAALKLLLEAGANVDAKTDDNETALQCAVKNNEAFIAQILLTRMQQEQELRGEEGKQQNAGKKESVRKNRDEDLPNTVRLVNPKTIAKSLRGSLYRIDDVFNKLDVSFPLTLYGHTSSVLWIAENGMMCLNTKARRNRNVVELPFRVGLPYYCIFPYWTGLEMAQDKPHGIYYETIGQAPRRSLIIEWYVTRHGLGSDYFHFNVKFEEADPGVVEFKYFNVIDEGFQRTIGVQGPSAHLQFSHNNPVVYPGLMLRFDTNQNTLTKSRFQL